MRRTRSKPRPLNWKKEKAQKIVLKGGKLFVEIRGVMGRRIQLRTMLLTGHGGETSLKVTDGVNQG